MDIWFVNQYERDGPSSFCVIVWRARRTAPHLTMKKSWINFKCVPYFDLSNCRGPRTSTNLRIWYIQGRRTHKNTLSTHLGLTGLDTGKRIPAGPEDKAVEAKCRLEQCETSGRPGKWEGHTFLQVLIPFMVPGAHRKRLELDNGEAFLRKENSSYVRGQEIPQRSFSSSSIC